MITLIKFLAGLNAIIDSRPIYKLGQDGRNGQCDCIGLIIGAIRRAGGEWKGTHGSNYAARNEMQTLESSPRLEIGTVMYKYHEPGEAGWNLPVTYKNHPDQNDYYHVGVVLSVSPLKIAHCTSWSGGSGIKIDTVIGKWRRGGRLKKIDYAAEPPKEGVDTLANDVFHFFGTVVAESGSTVKLRFSPNTKSQWAANVPVGARVEILQEREGWRRVVWEEKTGWMMSKHVLLDDAPVMPTPSTPEAPEKDYAALLEEAERLVNRLGKIIVELKG